MNFINLLIQAASQRANNVKPAPQKPSGIKAFQPILNLVFLVAIVAICAMNLRLPQSGQSAGTRTETTAQEDKSKPTLTVEDLSKEKPADDPEMRPIVQHS